MHEDDGDVAVSRWLCQAAPGTIARTTAAVSGFAGSHGMLDPVLARMTGAVTEALVEVFDAESDLIAPGDGTAVDAATDGSCLTVRLEGAGQWPADATSGRLNALAGRVELGFDARSDSMTVLLEFPADERRSRPRQAPGAGRLIRGRLRARPLPRRRPGRSR